MLYFFISMTVFLCGKIITPCAHYMLTLSPVLHPNSIKIGYFTCQGLDKSVLQYMQYRYCKITSLCAYVVSGTQLLQPAHICDILKALILVLSFSMTHYLDYSMMYHLIRGQSIIKLYIIYNMLEVLLYVS